MERNQLWEEGEYEAQPLSVMYRESSLNKTPYMEVSFKVGGQIKTVNLWLSEKAESGTLEKLKTLGFNGDFFESPAVDTTITVMLSMKHEEYKGSWKESWTYWGSRSAPIDRARAASLAAKFRQVNGGVAPKPAPAKPAAQKPAPPARPTPAANPASSSETIASNANEAWAVWCDHRPEAERDDDWTAIIKQYGDKTGDETKITPAEWNQIAKSAEIPF